VFPTNSTQIVAEEISNMDESITIYTIGHSNVRVEQILNLLQANNIQAVVDIRSIPQSRYSPQFNRKSLAKVLDEIGITYVYLGDSLGGRPNDPTCYQGSEVKYDEVMKRPWYQQGIEELLPIVRLQRTAILCSEEDPKQCHRHRLVGQTLLSLGFRVLHIRGNGQLEPASIIPEQPPLFE